MHLSALWPCCFSVLGAENPAPFFTQLVAIEAVFAEEANAPGILTTPEASSTRPRPQECAGSNCQASVCSCRWSPCPTSDRSVAAGERLCSEAVASLAEGEGAAAGPGEPPHLQGVLRDILKRKCRLVEGFAGMPGGPLSGP